MKNIVSKIIVASMVVLSLQACSDFEDINKDHNAADRNSVMVEGLFNAAVADAQLSSQKTI